MLTTPKVVAPRADAVSLVHSDAGELFPPGQGLQHLPDIGHDNHVKKRDSSTYLLLFTINSGVM